MCRHTTAERFSPVERSPCDVYNINDNNDKSAFIHGVFQWRRDARASPMFGRFKIYFFVLPIHNERSV